MPWPAAARIWLVLDQAASAPRSVAETTRMALDGGVDVVVCRLQETAAAEVFRIAAEVRGLCAAAGTPFVLSHLPELACQLEADAVHIGASDPPLLQVRDLVGSEMVIGYSSHSIVEANDQLAVGADYVFLGPIFPTPAKLKYGPPLGIDTARRAVREVNGTLVCIGGIDAGNLGKLLEAGVQRVAAIAALQHDCDPAQGVKAFRSVMQSTG